LLKVKPGRFYNLKLPKEDGVGAGTRWEGGKLARPVARATGTPSLPSNPLEPMFRKRFIIKADDLATWSLKDFQRFARFIEQQDAKAGLGIIPGNCDETVFAWVRTLDQDRFEIWNHTWTHGKGGPNHYGQPYDVQWRNLELAHNKVLKETGIVMHTFGGGGIKYQGKDVHDQDDVTHWVVRNHPDYKVHLHANLKFADRGLGNINSDGIFIPWRHSWFEMESFQPGAFVQKLKERWPDLDWNRPSALGNAEELKWRFDHPFWYMPESGQIEINVAQFHPAQWDDEKLKALGELIAYIRSKGNGSTELAEVWRFANAYETYKWLRDRDDIAIEKISATEYRLDTKSARFEHRLELRLPHETAVEEKIYYDGAFRPKRETFP
jgi:hypothetical protein